MRSVRASAGDTRSLAVQRRVLISLKLPSTDGVIECRGRNSSYAHCIRRITFYFSVSLMMDIIHDLGQTSVEWDTAIGMEWLVFT
jgi:hypothetical protein